MSDKENKSVAKNPLWEARRILGIKRGAYRRREEKQRTLEAEIRALEHTAKSLEASGEWS